MPHSSRNRIAALLVTVAAAVGLVSCGTDPSAQPSPNSAEPDRTAAPANLRWDTLAGIRIPVSAVDGPYSSSANGAVRHGYSQTPQGAVLAAINGQTALGTADDRTWPEVLTTVVAPGEGRDEFATTRALVSIGGTVPDAARTHFVGFRVVQYTSDPATAAVTIAQTRGVDPTVFGYPVALQWIEQDWRIVLPDTADQVEAFTITDLTDYTELRETT